MENSSNATAAAAQEEGVLRDVLEELDRERSKRAELELLVRRLQEKLEKMPPTPPKISEETIISKSIFLAMEAQVEGYQQLVHALTEGKPAIAAAAAAAAAAATSTTGMRGVRKSLPLHVIRMLEIIPWDPRAQEHIFGMEEVFEWQVYDVREKKWQSELKYFPVQIKSLPVVKPGKDSIMEEGIAQNKKERSLLVFLAGGDKVHVAPSKHGVLTNDKLTRLYNLEAGFSLPDDGGTWEWIGSWRIDKRAVNESDGFGVKPKVDCDDDGWSYAQQVSHFLTQHTELVRESPGPMESSTNGDTSFLRRFRRRRWTRQRVLVAYPYISERTQEYLKLFAANARLTMSLQKTSEQIVELKSALTETEGQLIETKELLRQKEELVKSLDMEETSLNAENGKGNVLQDFLTKNDQVKDIGTKLTQWVHASRKVSEDLTSVESSDETAHDTYTPNVKDAKQRFDWKRIGRGGFMDKMSKQSKSPGHFLRSKFSGGTGMKDEHEVSFHEDDEDYAGTMGALAEESHEVAADASDHQTETLNSI